MLSRRCRPAKCHPVSMRVSVNLGGYYNIEARFHEQLSGCRRRRLRRRLRIVCKVLRRVDCQTIETTRYDGGEASAAASSSTATPTTTLRAARCYAVMRLRMCC